MGELIIVDLLCAMALLSLKMFVHLKFACVIMPRPFRVYVHYWLSHLSISLTLYDFSVTLVTTR